MDLSKIQPLVVDVLAKKQTLIEAKEDSINAKARQDSLAYDVKRHEHLKVSKAAFLGAVNALYGAIGRELTQLEKLAVEADAHLEDEPESEEPDAHLEDEPESEEPESEEPESEEPESEEPAEGE